MYKSPVSFCILGGSGFVGHQIAASLSRQNHKITVLSRNPDRKKSITVLPNVELVLADCHDFKTLGKYFSKSDVVINLVGILNEKGDNGKGFYRAHVELAEKVIAACHQAGVSRLLHMSALNAHPTEAPSYYLQSKGEAEELILNENSEDFQVTAFRPSVIFGPQDSFFNRFAQILKKTPLLFPLACAQSKLSPVYIGDVVEAFITCIDRKSSFGKRYDLCGAQTMTLKEIVQYTAKLLKVNRKIFAIGNLLSKLEARILEFFPGQPMSRDNYRSLQCESTCVKNGLLELGITPRTIESIVPTYIANATSRSKYNRYRKYHHQ